MPTQCIPEQLEFSAVERRRVVAQFDGGHVSSDAGALLLQRTDEAIGLLDRLARCFEDRRDAELIEFPVRALVAQRVMGLALGYEDLNDHEQLRHDPLLGAVVGKLTARRDACAALAGKSTLNRLERFDKRGVSRYHKIRPDEAAIEALLVDLFVESHAPALEEIERIVGQIRQRWASTRIVLRADSGFAREALMGWCERHGVDYIFGLARNARLARAIGRSQQQALEQYEATGRAARVFQELQWTTRKSWSATRRVVAKAEQLPGKANPRFVVTSLDAKRWPARALYEELYCARGEMENRIKECQLDLFADRTSTATFRANQLRLWLSSFAYVLIESLRRLGLGATDLARATAGTIRGQLLKIGALVTLSVRRVKVAISAVHPRQQTFIQAYQALGDA